MDVVSKANIYAHKKHAQQKYGDKPFIFHPRQVAKVIKMLLPLDYNLQAAAVLHDTLEHTETIYEHLVDAFGEDVASLVKEVTRTDVNTFPYLKSRRGILLKYAEHVCNFVNMGSWSEEEQRKYIAESIFWII